MSNLAVDVLLGDEKRAGETIYNALTGRPVSATAVADAAVTIGSDLLMVVPGLGAAGAAVKAGRVAKTAAKGAKYYDKVNDAKQLIKSGKDATRTIKELGKDIHLLDKSGQKALNRAVKLGAKASATAEKYAKKAKRTTVNFAESTPAQLRKVAETARTAQKAYRAKRNTPRRKKMRHYGAAASATKDVYDFAHYLDNDE